MKRLADSLVLAIANLAVVGFLYVARRGSLPAIVALVCVPALFLLTLIFVLKDRQKTEKRIQSWIALVLANPSAAVLWSIRF